MRATVQKRESPLQPAGRPKGALLALLEQGSNVLQDTSPLRGFDAYVVGFHCPKHEPTSQMEAHHYCRVVNGDLLQCILFDGNTKSANLIGIEYILSGPLFDELPDAEKEYWHPHNFEVLSGQLVAPGLPTAAEKQFFKFLMNSYGKTWHTWHTGRHDDPGGDELPLGDPKLMWSFNRDGECDESLRESRDRAMGLDTEQNRADRQPLVKLAHPQRGVNAMRAEFTGTSPIDGVADAATNAPSNDETPAIPPMPENGNEDMR